MQQFAFGYPALDEPVVRSDVHRRCGEKHGKEAFVTEHRCSLAAVISVGDESQRFFGDQGAHSAPLAFLIDEPDLMEPAVFVSCLVVGGTFLGICFQRCKNASALVFNCQVYRADICFDLLNQIRPALCFRKFNSFVSDNRAVRCFFGPNFSRFCHAAQAELETLPGRRFRNPVNPKHILRIAQERRVAQFLPVVLGKLKCIDRSLGNSAVLRSGAVRHLHGKDGIRFIGEEVADLIIALKLVVVLGTRCLRCCRIRRN